MQLPHHYPYPPRDLPWTWADFLPGTSAAAAPVNSLTEFGWSRSWAWDGGLPSSDWWQQGHPCIGGRQLSFSGGENAAMSESIEAQLRTCYG